MTHVAQIPPADHFQGISPAIENLIAQIGHRPVQILPAVLKEKAHSAPPRIMVSGRKVLQGIKNNTSPSAIVPHHCQNRKFNHRIFDAGPEHTTHG